MRYKVQWYWNLPKVWCNIPERFILLSSAKRYIVKRIFNAEYCKKWRLVRLSDDKVLITLTKG